MDWAPARIHLLGWVTQPAQFPRRFRVKSLAAASVMLALGSSVVAAPHVGESEFRALYKELVETNTSLSAGDCTLAAQRMAAHLEAAGYAKSELEIFVPPGHPKEGGLVAVYPGRDPKLKAMLLLAHIDVVEAKREDWTRDPFTLVEEDGKFYARGVVDDKAEAAIFVDSLRGCARRNSSRAARSSSPSPAARKPTARSMVRGG